MAEKSGIAWTDSTFNPWLFPKPLTALHLPLVANAVRLEVPEFMAWMAERSAVAHAVGEFRELSHRLFMVRPEIAASVVATITTAIPISLEHGCPPNGVFRRAAKAQVALRLPITIGVVGRASRCALARDSRYPRPSFRRVLLAEPALVALTRYPHFFNSLGRVRAPLERRRLPLLEKLIGAGILCSHAVMALLRAAIGARLVIRKIYARLPCATKVAAVKTARLPILIFRERQPGRVRRIFPPAKIGASHG